MMRGGPAFKTRTRRGRFTPKWIIYPSMKEREKNTGWRRKGGNIRVPIQNLGRSSRHVLSYTERLLERLQTPITGESRGSRLRGEIKFLRTKTGYYNQPSVTNTRKAKANLGNLLRKES